MADYDKVSAIIFVEYFSAKGINDNGLAGLAGNLWHESGFYTNNLQNGKNAAFGMTDDEFTKACDEGRFNFLDPNVSFGYGLAQWTSLGRRSGLYNIAKSRNVSISDIYAQLDWMWEELAVAYKPVLAELRSSTNTIESCAEIVATKYEKSGAIIAGGESKAKSIAERTAKAIAFYNTFFKKEEEKPTMKTLAISAGHWLGQAGKRCDKSLDPAETREWSLNSRIATLTANILYGYEGIRVVRLDDPTGATFVTLATRSDDADGIPADYYLALHHNAGAKLTKSGGTVVYCKPGKQNNAKAFYNCVVSKTGLVGNRSKPINETTDLWEVKAPKMESILLENGFMDSLIDTPIILTDDHARKTAEGIAQYFITLWNLKPKSAEPTPVDPKPVTPSTDVPFNVKVTDPRLNIRSAPTTKATKIGQITDKGTYTVIDTDGEWGKIAVTTGWIHLGYTERV